MASAAAGSACLPSPEVALFGFPGTNLERFTVGALLGSSGPFGTCLLAPTAIAPWAGGSGDHRLLGPD